MLPVQSTALLPDHDRASTPATGPPSQHPQLAARIRQLQEARRPPVVDRPASQPRSLPEPFGYD